MGRDRHDGARALEVSTKSFTEKGRSFDSVLIAIGCNWGRVRFAHLFVLHTSAPRVERDPTDEHASRHAASATPRDERVPARRGVLWSAEGWKTTKGARMGVKIREGYIPFEGYKTYYRIAGECDQGRLPLLALHGGPGTTHWYLRSLDGIAERYGRAVIYYDQIGCGYSRTPSMPDFWCEELFERELVEVRRALGLDHVHILGQSWGGMLLMRYATHRPAGVASMVVASSPASADVWVKEAQRLRSYLPDDMAAALIQADEDGDYDRPEVKAATAEYYLRHVSRIPESERKGTLAFPEDDPVGTEVYNVMQGKSEFVITGKMRDFDVTADLPHICIPTLVTSGEADECTPYIAKQVADGIPGAEWHLFGDGATHCVHLEIPDEYNAVVEEFLERHE